MSVEMKRDPLWSSLAAVRDRLLVAMTEVERGDFLAAADELDEAARGLRATIAELRS